jgi:hypothetical protein
MTATGLRRAPDGIKREWQMETSRRLKDWRPQIAAMPK